MFYRTQPPTGGRSAGRTDCGSRRDEQLGLLLLDGLELVDAEMQGRHSAGDAGHFQRLDDLGDGRALTQCAGQVKLEGWVAAEREDRTSDEFPVLRRQG